MDHNSVSQNNTSPKRPTKPSNKKMIWAVLAGVAVFALVLIRVIFLQTTSAIPDTNGPDVYDLNTITAEDIEETLYDYSSSLTASSSDGKRSMIDDAFLKDHDYDCFSFSAGRFNGIKIIQATKIESDTLRLDITSEVKEGNFAIAILIDDKIEQFVDINSTQSVTLNGISGKTVLVKAVGESADCRIKVERHYE